MSTSHVLRRIGLGAMAVAMGALLVAGCKSGGAGDVGPGGVQPPARHAVHSDQLRGHMADLGRFTYKSMPQEIDPEEHRQQTLREAATAAGRIAETARYIPDVLANVRLDENNKQYFISLATKLEVQAADLSRKASSGSSEGVTQSLSRVQATCDACHTAFRVMPAVGSSTPNS